MPSLKPCINPFIIELYISQLINNYNYDNHYYSQALIYYNKAAITHNNPVNY